MASAMFCPCETRTSTCRNFATISSGLCCFLGILVLLDAKRHTSGRTTSKGEDQNDRWIAATRATSHGTGGSWQEPLNKRDLRKRANLCETGMRALRLV